MPARRSLLTIAVATLAVGARMPQPVVRWQKQASGVSVRLRGISAVSDRVAWASGQNGTVLRTTDGGATWKPRVVPAAEKLDFRDVDALSERVAYVLSIGNGDLSRIYKTLDGGAHWDLQFQNTDPRVFLDAMAFADTQQGIAFGDSVDGQFVILTTKDGGRTWVRTPADAARLPAALAGEGAFAASGTNVAFSGTDHIWIATTASRVLRSDGAGGWTAALTAMPASPSAGIFSIAFRGPHDGVVVGGDYKKEAEAVDNAAITSDGGATWTVVKNRGLSGFRSAVAWMSRSNASWIAVGPSGCDRSDDDGRTWSPLACEGFDAVSVVARGKSGWASGAQGRLARIDW
jgi:photosystem II stability/assembly factor-like uncharacterized protein